MRVKLFLVAIAVGVFASDAQAYVCSRVADSDGSESGASLSWNTRDLHFALHPDGTNDIPDDGELGVLRESFQAWAELELGSDATACSDDISTTDITFSEDDYNGADLVGYNFLKPTENQNLLIFHDSTWPHGAQAMAIIALTTTTYNVLTGEIFDADIEFNSAYFNFTITNRTASTDLKNTAVHEIGHFIGLGHSTLDESTMYASAPFGETKKRDLACDDRAAVVFKYPSEEANGYCESAHISSVCGNCAPPGALTASPTVKVLDSDDGTGGCNAVSPLPWLASIAVSYWLTQRIRRRINVA